MAPFPPSGYIGRIPVRNLWLLMLYASELSQFAAPRDALIDADSTDLPNLLARLLADAVDLRLRRNLTSGYRHRVASVTRVHGRIDILRTESQGLLDKGEVCCAFDELTMDTPRNRLIRAALDGIARLVSDPALAKRCRALAATLGRAGVGGVRPSRAELAREQWGRNDTQDRLVCALANLAFRLALPTEEAGTVPLPAPDREERWVRKLFEKAVLGFARLEVAPLGWRVRSSVRVHWQTQSPTQGIAALLPGMELDILLESPASGEITVIDTKFTAIVGADRFGAAKFKSGYIYQMYAYLRSQAGWTSAAGLFIHPAIDAAIDEQVDIQGHPIRFATVDLTASSVEVRTRLRELLRQGMQTRPANS